MSKLLEDEKVAKLIETHAKRAVTADRKRILESLKEVKATFQETEDKIQKRTATQIIAATNKIVRDTQPAAA